MLLANGGVANTAGDGDDRKVSASDATGECQELGARLVKA